MIEDGVMRIRIDNPETHNGLNWIGINQLADCFEMLKDKSIKVAVVTGNEQYFYTGGRVDPKVEGEKEKYAEAIDRYSKLMATITTPMIAAVSGNCMKAGMGLLEKCDFAIAKKGVKFSYPEVRMGGVPMMVMAETFGNMPKKRALEAYLTSWDFSAEDAYTMGLVNRVVEPEAFWQTVEEFVRVFLDTPPALVEMTRRAFFDMENLPDQRTRAEYAMNMLRTEVLTTMAKTETKYDI